MYCSFFEKQHLRRKPFHQKVLHFQYDVPLSQVKKLFDLFIKTTGGILFTAEDRSIAVKERSRYNEKIWDPSYDERENYGVFDENETFYMRLEIDSLNNTTVAEEVCGNLFIFAEETTLYKLADCFKVGCGQLAIEGTADYFALLED